MLRHGQRCARVSTCIGRCPSADAPHRCGRMSLAAPDSLFRSKVGRWPNLAAGHGRLFPSNKFSFTDQPHSSISDFYWGVFSVVLCDLEELMIFMPFRNYVSMLLVCLSLYSMGQDVAYIFVWTTNNLQIRKLKCLVFNMLGVFEPLSLLSFIKMPTQAKSHGPKNIHSCLFLTNFY